MSNRLIQVIRENFIKATNGEFLNYPANEQEAMVARVADGLPVETREHFS